MALALTIFGVAGAESLPIFCYGFIRHARGSGDYPPPTLPDASRTDGTVRLPVGRFPLELVTWDKFLDESELVRIQAELTSGQFTIPSDCPVEPAASIVGVPFGPIVVKEGSDRIRTSGAGILHTYGIAVDDGFGSVVRYLEAFAGTESTVALVTVLDMLSKQTGLGTFYEERRRLGCIEYFYRAAHEQLGYGPLFNVRMDKPDPRNRAPIRRLLVRRDEAPEDQIFRLHVTLKNFDEVVRDILIDVLAGQDEIVIEAETHVTDVELSAFFPDGQIADYVSGSLIQEMNFGLTVQGRADELPPVFAGAPESHDLRRRPRLTTIAFDGPGMGPRSGGLDMLRGNNKSLKQLVGEDDWKPENKWFEPGGDAQLEVIRWIKSKLEKPGTRSAYLVDPYLGSEALKRVIARQGNEAISLTVLVSPAKTDPDADVVDAKATVSHLEKLVATATEWSDRLCGKISIIHIRRGDGAKQAFHDRYLCLIDQRGMPTVYLLSNSLSKAAGAWPFAIAELNRITSRRVHFYIARLMNGDDGDRDLHAETVWEGKADSNSITGKSTADASSAAGDDQSPWVFAANRFLQQLRAAYHQHTTSPSAVSAPIAAFFTTWPDGIDPAALAKGIIEAVGKREEFIVAVSGPFSGGNSIQSQVAKLLDDHLLQRFLSNVAAFAEGKDGYFPFTNRDEYIGHMGRIISRMSAPTDFVRARLNPVLDVLVQRVEAQRYDFVLASEAMEKAIWLAAVALEVACHAQSGRMAFRIGLAADYIHWLGRLTRSDVAWARYEAGEGVADFWRTDLAFAANQAVAARQALAGKTVDAIERVLNDPLVLPVFTSMLSAKA